MRVGLLNPAPSAHKKSRQGRAARLGGVFAVAVAVWWGPPPGAMGRSGGVVNPPPLAEAAAVAVERGGEVEIPLRASGRVPGPLRFLIRRDPADGFLGEIRIVAKNAAVVTYRHSGTPGTSRDDFRFAVQAVDSPVSAPAEITISIKEPPPKIRGPASVDFGSVGIGGLQVREIPFVNEGGSAARVRLGVEAPWALDSPGVIELPAGETRVVVVGFRPGRVGVFGGTLRVSDDPPVLVTLGGEGIAIFDLDPDGEIVATGPSREFPPVKVNNLTDREIAVGFSVPGHIVEPEPMVLQAGAVGEVRFQISGGWKGPVEGGVVVGSEGSEKHLSLRAAGAPARLVTAGPQALDLGEIPAGTRVSFETVLGNRGGSPAMLDADVPADFVVIPAPESIVLPPGASRAFTVALESTRTGTIQEDVVFREPGGSRAALAVRATIVSDGPSAAPGAPAGAIPTRRLILPEPPVGIPGAPQDGDVWMPPGGFQLLDQSPGSVVIGWSEDEPAPLRYLLEWRSIEYAGDDLPPRILWHPMPEVRFQRKSGNVTATIMRLPPNSSWFMRFVPVGSDGRRMTPSGTLRIASPPLPRAPWTTLLIVAVLCAAAAAFAVHAFLKVRAAAHAAERKRIARLENRP